MTDPTLTKASHWLLIVLAIVLIFGLAAYPICCM